MKAIWNEERKLHYLLRVEVALSKAEAELGVIPKEAAEQIEEAAGEVTLTRVAEIEEEIHHDIIAVVEAIAEKIHAEADYVHGPGATSNDIIDTALALQLRDSCAILKSKLIRLRNVLVSLADENKDRACAARIDGQGSGWTDNVWSAVRRLGDGNTSAFATALRSAGGIEVGQMTGAVGTQAAFGKQAVEIKR